AGEIDMVLRVAKPHERREQYAVFQHFGLAAHNLAQQQAVGEYRHVPTMLFQRRDRNNDRRVGSKSLNFGPGKLRKQHGRFSRRMAISREARAYKLFSTSWLCGSSSRLDSPKSSRNRSVVVNCFTFLPST